LGIYHWTDMDRIEYIGRENGAGCRASISKGRILSSFCWILAVVILLASGIVYRVAASRLEIITKTPIALPVPLKLFPSEVTDWVGQDVPIPPNIQRVAGNDDFLNRLYVNKRTNESANIYVAYSARPRTMLGHRPQVCYPAGGWIHDSTQQIELVTRDGMKISCLLHRFHWPSKEREEQVVLNFYILNGQVTCSEKGFSGVGWRTPNIRGNPARYVAQVQISSDMENSVQVAARDLVDSLLAFFPRPPSLTKAGDSAQTSDGSDKTVTEDGNKL
jgi:hypothetical protein